MQRAWTLALTLLVVSTGFAGSADAAAVTAEPTKLDLALVGASAAMVDGKMYIFGGRDANDQYSPDIRKYDPATKTLTKLATQFPTPAGGPTVGGSAGRYSGTAVAFGGKIYFFGGTQVTEVDINADGQPEPLPRAVKDIFEFDPADNGLELLSDRLPVGTWGMSGVATSSAIYLFGGFTFDYGDIPNTGRHDWVLRFDPSKPEGSTGSGGRLFELDTKLPYAVQDAAAALLGRRVYIMGGLSDHDAEDNPCPTQVVYDPDTDERETKQIEVCVTKRIVTFDPTYGQETAIGVAGELPYRAQFIHAGVVNSKAYVSGAFLSDGTASSSIIEVSADRAGTPQIRVLTPALPTGTFGQAVASDGQTILLAGGRTGSTRDLTAAIQRLDPRPTPPWAPRSASASEITGGVRLTWEAPTYNGDTAVTGYRIYRTPVGGLETRLTEINGFSYDDTGVRPGTEYAWRIAAVNAVGESEQSARLSRSSGVAVPGPVAAFSAFPDNNAVLLRWRPPEETGGSNLTGYRILRDGTVLASPAPADTQYVDRTAKNGETYSYQVRATNAKGEGVLSPIQRVTPANVPPPPGGLVAEVVSTDAGSAVRLSWVAPVAPVDNYIVLRATLPGRTGTVVANLTTTTFTDTEVERGRTYYYSVASENDVGRSPPSTEEQVALVRKPGAPGEVTAVGLEGEVRLTWAAPIDTGDAPESALRYYVSRQGGGSSRAIIVKTDIEGTTFVDRSVTPGQTYAYTVTTLNPMASDPSEASSATPRVIQNKPPVALLSILPPLAQPQDPVELDASQSSDIDGGIREYLFDFGDGTDPVRTDQPTIFHAYAINGTFSATVIVTDTRGEVSAPATAQIIVGEVVGRTVETGLPGRLPGGQPTSAPGSTDPEVPGPSAGLVLLALVTIALVLRRRG